MAPVLDNETGAFRRFQRHRGARVSNHLEPLGKNFIRGGKKFVLVDEEKKGTKRVVYTFVSPPPRVETTLSGGWLSSATVDAHPLVEGLRRRRYIYTDAARLWTDAYLYGWTGE